MPAYKDVERQSPEELAEFILKERICKNCRWWERRETYMNGAFGICEHTDMVGYVENTFEPHASFGCNQWKKKE